VLREEAQPPRTMQMMARAMNGVRFIYLFLLSQNAFSKLEPGTSLRTAVEWAES
jgi:hypothetical protein